jgi:hypothetical protein
MIRVSIRDGIGPGGTVGGTEVFRLDESDVPNPSVTSFTAFTGQTITVHGSVLAPAP